MVASSIVGSITVVQHTVCCVAVATQRRGTRTNTHTYSTWKDSRGILQAAGAHIEFDDARKARNQRTTHAQEWPQDHKPTQTRSFCFFWVRQGAGSGGACLLGERYIVHWAGTRGGPSCVCVCCVEVLTFKAGPLNLRGRFFSQPANLFSSVSSPFSLFSICPHFWIFKKKITRSCFDLPAFLFSVLFRLFILDLFCPRFFISSQLCGVVLAKTIPLSNASSFHIDFATCSSSFCLVSSIVSPLQSLYFLSFLYSADLNFGQAEHGVVGKEPSDRNKR